MGSSQTTEAIVLRGADVGEEDRILTLLTYRQGLVRAAAGGARSIRKGRAAALDLFVHTRLEIYTSSRGNKMPRIRAAEPVDLYLSLRRDYDRVCAASYMAEVLSRCVWEADPAPELFQLMKSCLHALDGGEERFHALLVFLSRALSALGMSPMLDRCVHCGEPVTGEGVLDNFSGGVAHAGCLSGAAPQRSLTGGDLATLRFLAQRPLERVWSLAVQAQQARPLFETMAGFAHYHLGFVPRTWTSLAVGR